MNKKTLIALLAVCLCLTGAMAQPKPKPKPKPKAQPQTNAPKVLSMRSTNDFIPGDDQRKDFNRKPCALVKVQVIDDVTDVEGNVMGDVVNKGVEKWVYMASGSRNMKIHFGNNLPLKVDFKNYDIQGLKGNRIYELSIDVPNKPKAKEVEEVKGNYLQMRVVPEKTTVVLWGDDMTPKSFAADQRGEIKVYLPYGRYHYKATATDYQTMEGSVFVNDENRWESVQLAPIMGALQLQCPEGQVEYTVNGQRMELAKKSTTWHRQVVPGVYKVEATVKAKRKTVRQNVEAKVTGERTTVVTFDYLQQTPSVRTNVMSEAPVFDFSTPVADSPSTGKSKRERAREAKAEEKERKPDQQPQPAMKQPAIAYTEADNALLADLAAKMGADIVNMNDGSYVMCTVRRTSKHELEVEQGGKTYILKRSDVRSVSQQGGKM